MDTYSRVGGRFRFESDPEGRNHRVSYEMNVDFRQGDGFEGMDDVAMIEAVQRNVGESARRCVLGLKEVIAVTPLGEHHVAYDARSRSTADTVSETNLESRQTVFGVMEIASEASVSGGEALLLSIDGVADNVANAVASNILTHRHGGRAVEVDHEDTRETVTG